MMVLQLIVPQVHLQAKGSTGEVQVSEGQKNGKRSEVFEFKNTEKERPSWFNMGTQSLFRARNVGLTKSEKVKIETSVKGLDEGEKAFNWEAFGQNKKFEAWVEVAYKDEVDEKGEPIRHKVSEDFEISAVGTINTTITVDASKTVDNYYIVTEYDKDPDSFKINAFFQKTTIVSDKGEKSIAFKLDVQQIVSTKITYNLIDEYGKAIDLNDAKEAKPADTDLENLAKLGNGTDDPVVTFNLKKDGTEILWQERKLDEFDLTDSSLKLIFTKNEIQSNNIDYKLISTYDIIKGGTVTIKRQKDVVTPKDPHNPGTKPEGYARINLSADALGGGPAGTFTKDNPGDTQRVVDVKEGKPYTVAKAEIDKQGKPFPLTNDNKVDTGKVFKAWAPELSDLGTAVADETKTLNATYQTSKEEIIPYLPTEPVPTHDKDNLPIPTDYVTVTFKSEDATKGNVKIGDKEGATVLAKVKPGIDLSQKPEITTAPAKHYGFTKWDPALTKAAANQIYTAYFVKSGEEIGEKDPIPNGWYRVTVSQDADSIQAGTVPTKYYPVEPGDKLAEGKFPSLTNAAKDGYKDPAWYVGSDKVEKPYEVVINSSIDFVARATELDSHKITKDNGLKPVDITAYKGDEIGEGFWKKGVALTTPDENLQKLLDAATVTDQSGRTTTEAGEKIGTLKVTFLDGSFIEVQNQKLTVIDTKVDIDYNKEKDKDANAPRHKDEVVKGKIKTSETVEGAKVEILDKDNKVIGITLANADGSFIAGTRPLEAGETIKVRVTLPKADKASPAVEKIVKLNPDRLNQLLPIAKAQKDSFSKKQNAIIKERLKALEDAITTADPLVDAKGKATATDTAENQTAIDNAVTALEEALKKLTANIPPTISGPKTHEIFVGEALDLKGLVDVTDGDGADDLVVESGLNVKITAVKVDGQTETPVTDLTTIKDTVGTYNVTYTAKDKANAEVTHEMTLTVKERTNSAIEVTKDPSKMSYLITEKDGKAQLNLEGMTLNLVDNLGKKTKVELTDPKVTFKVNGKPIRDGGDLTLADDVQFIEVEYTPEGSQNPLKAQTKGVLRVGPDYDNDGTDDRTQNFDPKNIEKLEVIKQPKLDYIAKDKSEADKVFKLNLESMIVRMTDKAGKEKLAVVKEGKFVDYDDTTKAITVLTATPAHGATLTPETGSEESQKGDNGKTVAITGPNNSKAETDKLKVFYDANKDGTPDHKDGQKTPAPSAMARNVGENPQGTTVEGMATPGAVIKITDKDGTALTTEPKEVVAGPDGKYKATVPLQADGTEIKVTAKLGEMGESDPTPAKVFDDKNDNKQPDRDEGFNIEKATDIKFVDQPDLTYLVASKDKEVTFDGKDGKGKAIYLELSYQNGKKTESKIMTLEELIKDTTHISVTPANGTTDKKENQTHELVGKAIEVKLKNVVEKQGSTEDQKTAATATSTSKFAIEIDVDDNGKADKDEQTEMPAIISARNVKNATQQDKIETKVKVKALVGSIITIKDENGKVISDDVVVPAKGNDKYNEVEITLKEKQDAGKKVQAIAKLGEKQPSEPAESIVFQDLDGDNKPDGQGELDIANIVEFKLASNPDKMKYPLKSTDAQETLDLTGLMVYLKDKNGNTGIFEYNKKQESPFEELKGNDKFKLELVKDQTTKAIDENTKLSTADDLSKVKATLQIPNSNGQGKVDGKSVETSQLEVFLDANGDGERDTNQTPAPKDLKALNKGNDAFTTITGKAQAGDVIKVYDEDGKEITTDPVTVTAGNDGTFTIKVSKDSKALPKNTKLFVTAKANDKKESPRTPVFVKTDADSNGIADEYEQTPEPTVTARNIGTDGPDGKKVPATETTVEIKTEPKAKVTIEYTDKDGQPKKIENLTAGEDGKLTQKIEPKLDAGTEVKVTVTDGEKKPATKTANVFDDLDGNGKNDAEETTTIESLMARNIGTDGANGKEKAKFTTIHGKAEKGSTVTITFTEEGKSEVTTKTVTADATTGEYKLELKGATEAENILLPAGTPVSAQAKFGNKKPSNTLTENVFDDLDDNKIPDNQAGQTERPAAIASNIGKNPTFTTITGEAEKGAKVVAKVGNTVVGEATADSETGKYTIKATTDGTTNGAPIKQGVKIDITATLAPKDESLKQTVVVFKDTDGDGQPDSSKDFNVKKATGMQVVASPDKMVYTDGDQLNLDGLRVLIKDVYGNQKIFTYNSKDNKEFTDAGLSVDYKQNDKLSNNDNGKKLTVTLDTKDNKEVDKAITGETPTALTVNKKQSAKPTELAAANQGDAKVTKVKGKAVSGAEIKVTDKAGNNLLPDNTTVKADSNGDFTADLNKLLDPGTKVYFTATESGKTESPKEEETVIRDKDGNWKADTGSKISTPVIDPIREKDEKVVVEAPKADDKIQTITVEDQNGNTVKLTKDPADATGKTWIVDGSKPVEKVVENNDGKLEIPVKGKLPLNDRDQIKVTFKDGENPANEAFDKETVQKASQKPTVDPVYTGEKEVKIVDPTVADPTAKTLKVKVGDNDTMVIEKKADNSWKIKNNPSVNVEVKDGKVIVPLEDKAKKGDVIKVSTINDSNIESPKAEVKVVDKELTEKPTIKEADKDTNFVTGTAAPGAKVTITVTPKNGEPKTFIGEAGKDGNYKVVTDTLVDGDKVVAKASEPGKADNTSDEKTVGVKTSELQKSIEKAEDPTIGGKDGVNLDDKKPIDKELKDALEKGKDVKAKGDAGDPNTDQKAVDKAKEDLDKAIAQKEADTAVDKAKDDPSPENIKDAQDKIDAIPGTVNDNPIKKELQDKLDLIKKIKEGEDRLNKDDVTGKNNTPKKPQEDIDALKKAVEDGKKQLDPKDPDYNKNVPGTAKEIEKALEEIDKEQVVLSFNQPASGSKRLIIHSLQNYVTIEIYVAGQRKLETKTLLTSSVGALSVTLEEALESGQEVKIIGKKTDLKDGWSILDAK